MKAFFNIHNNTNRKVYCQKFFKGLRESLLLEKKNYEPDFYACNKNHIYGFYVFDKLDINALRIFFVIMKSLLCKKFALLL